MEDFATARYMPRNIGPQSPRRKEEHRNKRLIHIESIYCRFESAGGRFKLLGFQRPSNIARSKNKDETQGKKGLTRKFL